MARGRHVLSCPQPSRGVAAAGTLVCSLAALALMSLVGCAAPASDPPVATTAATTPAAPPGQEVRIVSDALNRRLDHMLGAPAGTAGQ